MSERDLGRHEEAIDNLKTEVHALRTDIAEIKTILATAKGGWKVMLAVGGAAGAVGAGVMKAISLMKGGV